MKMTEAVTAPPAQVTVRPAKAEDVVDIFETIGYWAGQGKMLVRPMQNIFENLRDFFVAEVDGQFAGLRGAAYPLGRHRRGAGAGGAARRAVKGRRA